MMRWLLASVGSTVWSMLVFSIGMMMFFPSDWVKEQLTYQVQSQTRKKMLLHIEDASASGFMGVELTNVSLFESKPGRRAPGQKERPARENTLLGSLKSVALSPQILPLLSGTVATDLSLELDGGDIDTSFGMNTSQFKIGTDIQGFNLAAQPISLTDGALELSGALNLFTDIAIDRDDIKNSTGDLQLTVENLGLVKGVISGFELAETTFSEAVLEMEVEDGKANVTKGSFVGDLLEATIEGHITLRKDISRSRLSLSIKVQFDETLDKLAKIALKSSRDEDGVYHFKGQGTLMNPRFRADRVNKSAAGRRANLSNQDDEKPGGANRSRKSSQSTSDEDRDERRAKRKERLKKRRERMKKRREERRGRSSSRDNDRDADRVDDRDRDRDRDRRDYDDVDDRYEDDRRDNYPRGNNNNEPPVYEEDVEPDYNNNNNNANRNDYEDANDNGNLEDLGYLDE